MSVGPMSPWWQRIFKIDAGTSLGSWAWEHLGKIGGGLSILFGGAVWLIGWATDAWGWVGGLFAGLAVALLIALFLLLIGLAVQAIKGWFSGPHRAEPISESANNTAMKPVHQLLEAFEQHAIREFELSGMCKDYGNKILDMAVRGYYKDRLRAMEKACQEVKLDATLSAIETAFDHFNEELTFYTAYAQFRGITQTMLKEALKYKRMVHVSTP